MIVSDREKFVFVHNPKCGGMTCHNALLKYDTRNNFFFEWKRVNGEGKILDMAHITPMQLRRFFPRDFKKANRYYKFVFVRNPYNRFMSSISQHLKLMAPAMRTAILTDENAFYHVARAFALHGLRAPQIENEHKLVHFRIQCNFANIDGQRWVDEVFKLEDLDFQSSPAAKWLPDMGSTARNTTNLPSSSGYDIKKLGDEAIAAINEFYDRDFSTFGYEKL